jgi:ketosteroid isomerase-like protein
MTTTPHRELDEADIEKHIGKIADGIRARDIEALRPLYAEDVVSFDVEPPLRHVGVDAKLANWTRVFTVFQEVEYEVRDLVLAVGDTVAFGRCFGRLHGKLANGTETEGMWVRATICLEKREAGWLIVHDQASVPFDVISGKGVTDLEP